VTKAWDTLESAQERVEIFKDTDFVLSTEKTNKILAVLTVIFTLTIPATMIGTLMGMNINLPGGVESPWLFFGPYTTLIVIVVASLVPAAFMMWFFRRWRWW
jgi:magnesium transporter